MMTKESYTSEFSTHLTDSTTCLRVCWQPTWPKGTSLAVCFFYKLGMDTWGSCSKKQCSSILDLKTMRSSDEKDKHTITKELKFLTKTKILQRGTIMKIDLSRIPLYPIVKLLKYFQFWVSVGFLSVCVLLSMVNE